MKGAHVPLSTCNTEGLSFTGVSGCSCSVEGQSDSSFNLALG